MHISLGFLFDGVTALLSSIQQFSQTFLVLFTSLTTITLVT